jgi:dTDP-glucose pyrophosphorylase
MTLKGLIPAAGNGSRMGPFTRAIPKELLPVGDKAVMEHNVIMMVDSGITDIVIVVSPCKHGLSDYFGSGKRFGANFTYVVQDETDGLAGAVLAGEHAIGGSAFVVALGDTFFTDRNALVSLMKRYSDTVSVVAVSVAEVDDVSRYGIIEPLSGVVLDVIEKPHVHDAPSTLGMTGLYVFRNDIFDAIRMTERGYNNEYQLTDTIKILIDDGHRVVYNVINGEHIDVGTPEDLMRANEYYLQKLI